MVGGWWKAKASHCAWASHLLLASARLVAVAVWPPGLAYGYGGQTAEATSLADAKSKCDAHAQCDAFAFHQPPTTSTAQNSWFGYMFMYKLRQTKGDHTLSQWLDAVTWTSTSPYGASPGTDFRLFWAIDECLVSG